MANIIDTSFFFGELNIAQVSESTVASAFQWFIDEKEPEVLTNLFGYELYKNFLAGVGSVQKYTVIRDGVEYTNSAGQLTKWKGLKFTMGTAKKSLIANYVYCKYMSDQASITTGTGVKVAKAQNAVDASEVPKIVKAWNQMAEWNCDLVGYLVLKQEDYPEFIYGRKELYPLLKRINTLGI